MKAGREEKDPDAKPTVGFALPRVGDKRKMRRSAPVRKSRAANTSLEFAALSSLLSSNRRVAPHPCFSY